MHDPTNRPLLRLRLWFLGLASMTAIAACTGLLGFDNLRLAPHLPVRPPVDLTAGGNRSASSKYRLVAALGESAVGTVVGKSPSYKLYGGVVGTWQ